MGGKRARPAKAEPREQAEPAQAKRAALADAPTDKAVRAMAKKHWPANGAVDFQSEVVVKVYEEYLSKPPSSKRTTADPLSALEVSGYLERYLLPHFDAQASPWVHAMSVVMLSNLKFREGVSAWDAFRAEPAKFAAFLARILDLPDEKKEITFDERAQWTQFLIHAFQSLENDMARTHHPRCTLSPSMCTHSIEGSSQPSRN